MTAVPFPLAPIIGEVFRGFAYNGRTWVQSRGAEWSNVHVFTASGRYEPSENLIYAIIECIGPGGGGGWATGDIDGVQTFPTAAGGGGSGGYSRKTLPAELLTQGADVVIGMGGLVSAGTPGGGKTSGTTSFGGLCVANGGGDAQAFDGSGTVQGHGLPGAGAAIGIGDFRQPGSAGGMWATLNINVAVQHLVGVAPGLGGQLFGGAAWPTPVAGSSWLYQNIGGANAAPNSGAGGGGAQVNTTGAPQTTYGGAGGSGLCVVTEICGTENGGGGGGGGGTNWPFPPGVEPKVNLRARVTKDGCCG